MCLCPFVHLLPDPAWLAVDVEVPLCAFELPAPVCVEVGVGGGVGVVVGVGQVVVDVLLV